MPSSLFVSFPENMPVTFYIPRLAIYIPRLAIFIPSLGIFLLSCLFSLLLVMGMRQYVWLVQFLVGFVASELTHLVLEHGKLLEEVVHGLVAVFVHGSLAVE